MKIIEINSSTSTTTRTIHGVNVPAQFSSEAERSKLLDSLFDLDLNKAQVTEVRTAIKAVPIATNNNNDTVKREYALTTEQLFGVFVDNKGDSVRGTGTKDLPTKWNLASPYDNTGLSAFQIVTGIENIVFFDSKPMDSTIFNGSTKRASNNIKSAIANFQDNQNHDSPKFMGKDCKMEVANEARAMYIEGMNKLLPEIKALYERLAALNIEPITLENIQKRLDAKKNAIVDTGKAKAMELIAKEAQEQGLSTDDYVLVQASQNGYDSPEAYIASRIAA